MVCELIYNNIIIDCLLGSYGAFMETEISHVTITTFYNNLIDEKTKVKTSCKQNQNLNWGLSPRP